MRKLYITCDCGQQMQVPRSAIGKMGQCPACGERIPINHETTTRQPQATSSIGPAARGRWGAKSRPNMDAKQQFGRAVDLYCAGRYGEALAIFDALQAEFPDSMEIARARRQCAEARSRDPLALAGPEGHLIGDEIDADVMRSVRRVAIEKMLHGSSDDVQIRAAELVARLSGMLDPQGGTPANGAAHGLNGRAATEPAEAHAVDLEED